MTSASSAAVTVIDGEITVDAEALADSLGLTVAALREEMARGLVTGVAEAGIGEDAGSLRLTFRYRAATWQVVVKADGARLDGALSAGNAAPGGPGRPGLSAGFGKRS